MIVEDRLSDILSEFARTLLTDFPIQGILDHLVVRIAEVLPIDAAGVSLISPSTYPRFIAGSDESATRYEHLQTDLKEGPCLAAYDTEEAISIPDLALDDRFPKFAENALAEGLVAVFTFPLRHAGRCLGALDLYRTTAGALDARDLGAAQTLADVATAYLLNAQSREDKTQLVATVSHELRTPMTSIAGNVGLLREGRGGPLTAAQERLLRTVQRNCDRLTALADDLLTLAGLEPGSTAHQQVPVDLVHVVSAVRATIEVAIVQASLDVSFDVPDSPVMVHGYVDKLESLVSNLMTNALKFTPPGGWVRCTLQIGAGQARLEVSDNGLGIPVDEQADLFSRYFRTSIAYEHAIEGTGLGLTIAEAIVRSHGGDIRVDSQPLVGSTFIVDLPLIIANADPSP